jgi:hypothetical protein
MSSLARQKKAKNKKNEELQVKKKDERQTNVKSGRQIKKVMDYIPAEPRSHVESLC